MCMSVIRNPISAFFTPSLDDEARRRYSNDKCSLPFRDG